MGVVHDLGDLLFQLFVSRVFQLAEVLELFFLAAGVALVSRARHSLGGRHQCEALAVHSR